MALSSALSWPAREKAAASGAEPGLFAATLSLAQYRDAPEGRRAVDVYGVYDACDTQMTECREDPQCLACMKVYNPDQVVANPAADASAALTCTAALTALEQVRGDGGAGESDSSEMHTEFMRRRAYRMSQCPCARQ